MHPSLLVVVGGAHYFIAAFGCGGGRLSARSDKPGGRKALHGPCLLLLSREGDRCYAAQPCTARREPATTLLLGVGRLGTPLLCHRGSRPGGHGVATTLNLKRGRGAHARPPSGGTLPIFGE